MIPGQTWTHDTRHHQMTEPYKDKGAHFLELLPLEGHGQGCVEGAPPPCWCGGIEQPPYKIQDLEFPELVLLIKLRTSIKGATSHFTGCNQIGVLIWIITFLRWASRSSHTFNGSSVRTRRVCALFTILLQIRKYSEFFLKAMLSFVFSILATNSTFT